MPAARLLCIFLAMAGAAFGQGGGAVITLTLPPPGGEGFTALQSGAALAEGATAAWYNPAALAELHRSTGSRLGFAQSRQDTLGVFMRQSFTAADFVMPDPARGTDIGVGFFRNDIRFPEEPTYDAQDNSTGTFRGGESIWGLAIAGRLGVPMSAGVSAKFIDSRLGPGSEAQAWAFDVGLLFMPRFPAPASWGLPILFTPSAGLVASNIGPEVTYSGYDQSDPLPRTFTGAMALAAEGWGLVSATAETQAQQEWTRRTVRWYPVLDNGFALDLFCLEWGRSWLAEPEGHWHARHESLALLIDPRRWALALARLRSGDFSGPSADLERRYPARYLSPWGLRPRLTAGWRKTYYEDLRTNRSAWFFTFAL